MKYSILTDLLHIHGCHSHSIFPRAHVERELRVNLTSQSMPQDGSVPENRSFPCCFLNPRLQRCKLSILMGGLCRAPCHVTIGTTNSRMVLNLTAFNAAILRILSSLACIFFFLIQPMRSSSPTPSLKSDSALTSARESKELNRGKHVPHPTRKMDVLVSGAVDGVDGVDVAATQLQPLTVDQERHHVEKVHGEQASVSGREADRGSKKKGPA